MQGIHVTGFLVKPVCLLTWQIGKTYQKKKKYLLHVTLFLSLLHSLLPSTLHVTYIAMHIITARAVWKMSAAIAQDFYSRLSQWY